MKRKAKVEIEIDCNKKTCGSCEILGIGDNFESYCPVFKEYLEGKWFHETRCPECLKTFK